MNTSLFFPYFIEVDLKKDVGQIPLQLSRLGHNVSLVVYRNEDNDKLNNYENVNIVKINKPEKFTHYRFPITYIKYLLENYKNIDCLIYYFMTPGTILVSIIFKLLVRKGIFLVHLDTDGRFSPGKRKHFIFLLKLKEKLFFRILNITTDMFFVQAPESRERIAKRCPQIFNKTYVLTSGLQMDIFNRYFVKDQVKEKTILFVAFIAYRKRLDMLVEVFSRIASKHSGWKIRIVGKPLEKDYLDSVLEKIKQYGLEKRIQYLGALSDEELMQEYRKAEVFCMASRSESFGLVLVESMFFGCCPISSDVGGAQFILGYGNAGMIFENENVEDFEKKLDKLLGNPVLRAEISRNAMERCRKIFDWKKIVFDLNTKLNEIQLRNSNRRLTNVCL